MCTIFDIVNCKLQVGGAPHTYTQLFRPPGILFRSLYVSKVKSISQVSFEFLVIMNIQVADSPSVRIYSAWHIVQLMQTLIIVPSTCSYCPQAWPCLRCPLLSGSTFKTLVSGISASFLSKCAQHPIGRRVFNS